LLTPHKPPILHIPFDFSPDGKTLFISSDQAGEFRGLHTIDLVTKKLAKREQPKWDVEAAGFSQGGNYFYSMVNADGAPEVTIVEAKTNKPVALPAVGAPGPLVPLATSRSDRYVAALLQTDVAPQVVWVLDLKEGKGHRVADPLPPGSFDDFAFTAGQSVRVKSFDGLEVPAFLYAPKGHGPFPAVIDVHGGPTMQARRGFDNRTQYLVSKGYVVLVPNVRGSTGYGKTYTRGDDKDFGGAPLKDIVACKQWLIDHAHVDGGKVAIMGASYGGYMTLAAATFFPKEFAAHVDISGFSDLKTLVESFPAYWAADADRRHQKYGNPNDPKDAQYQHDRSPIHFIDKIERPLLVVQGANDPRVRKDQSDRLVEALKQRGVAVDYLVLEGEGHVFVGQNGFYIMEVIDRFLDKHIFGDTEVEAIPRF
jgi:dipeptidyl aminopeptidase/acylaminoacyl peptidase